MPSIKKEGYKKMTNEEFENLGSGDIVRHKLQSGSYLIDANLDKSYAIGIRIVFISNPDEWDLVHKVNYKESI